MRFVDRLDRYSQDLMIPGRYSDPDGFVMGDGYIPGLSGNLPRAVSIGFMREAARRIPQVGLVNRGALEDAVVEIKRERERAEQAEAKLAEAEAKLDRVNGFAKDGFKVVRQQGRPPVKQGAGV